MELKLLEDIGLTKNEADVYWILLQLHETLASRIALKTKISRPHVYDALNKLLEKGFASYILKNGKKYFRPINPKKILDIFKEKEYLIEKNIPELIKMFEPLKEKPVIEVYEGAEGIKTILNDMIKVGKEMLAFNTLGKEFYKYIPDYIIERYLYERKKHRIKSRQFYVKGAQIIKHPMVTYKKIPQEYSQITLFVYGDNVVMFILIDPILAIKIKSKEVAKLYKNQFEIMWSIIK